MDRSIPIFQPRTRLALFESRQRKSRGILLESAYIPQLEPPEYLRRQSGGLVWQEQVREAAKFLGWK